MQITGRKLNALGALLGAAVVAAGCSRSDWKANSYERGDTTVMRTVSGSAWGGPAELVERARIIADPSDTLEGLESVTALANGPNGDLYVVDAEKPVVRQYDRNGQYVRAFVVPLGEPGHYSRPNGVAVLSDGRVVIRDPKRSQLVVYSPRGVFLERWPHPSGVYSPIPLLSDAQDRLYTRLVYNPSEPREAWKEGLVRYSADGSIEDTIPDPEIGYVPPSLMAQAPDGDTLTFRIPLTARAYWTRTPAGDVVTAISDRYALQVAKPDGSVLRIEREYEPVPASREERSTLYRDVDRKAKQIDYRWTWRGAIIPEEKPPFKGLFADADGRIWTQLHQPAELIGEFAASAREAEAGADSATAPESEDRLPRPRDWREPIAFDVFEPDGRYLGQVSAPPGFRTRPLPSIRGNTVWAAVSNRGDVPDIVRFEIKK
jgi:hypothetical protein